MLDLSPGPTFSPFSPILLNLAGWMLANNVGYGMKVDRFMYAAIQVFV